MVNARTQFLPSDFTRAAITQHHLHSLQFLAQSGRFNGFAWMRAKDRVIFIIAIFAVNYYANLDRFVCQCNQIEPILICQ